MSARSRFSVGAVCWGGKGLLCAPRVYLCSWYRINTAHAGWTSYGFQEGCNFIGTRDCGPTGWGAPGSGVSARYVLPQEAYPTVDSGGQITQPAAGHDTVCTADRLAYGPNEFSFSPQSELCNGDAATAADFNAACTVKPWEVPFAPQDGFFMRWASTSKFRNKCPIVAPYGNGYCALVDPSESRGASGGDNSRCFAGNLMREGWSTSGRSELKQARCYQMQCLESGTLQILVGASGEVAVDCPAEGGDIEVPGYTGVVQCPPYSELCGIELASQAARAALQDPSSLRIKGLIPLSGGAGTVLRVTARALDLSTSAYVGGVGTDSCTAGATMESDAATNQVACEAAGGTFTGGFTIDEDDPEMGALVVPARPDGSAWPDGAVDIVLRSSGAQEDTALQGFVFDSSKPINLIDDAMTRQLTGEVQAGGMAELTTGPTWHMVYYWLQRDEAPFVAGTEDDIFYA